MATLDELESWLRLTLARGVGGASQRALLKAFGSPETVLAASRAALAAFVGPEIARALLDADCREAVAAALAWASAPGRHILALGDADYPSALLDTPDPPTVLYVHGNPALLNRPALSIVGSRNATPAGLKTAEAFAGALAGEGQVIVSGLALGIDTAAHRGALAAGGDTVAVIGTGCDRIYPARNQTLAHEIASRGAIVSEFPLGTPAAAGNFPRRNRLIAGMSRGVLVVEAALRSGSLITARLGGELGREVFAVPGSIHSPLSKGCHALIRQGAKLVETAADVLEELAGVRGTGAPDKVQLDAASVGGSAFGVLTALGHDPCGIDELIERSGLGTDALLALLLELELAGQVASLPGGRYQRIE